MRDRVTMVSVELVFAYLAVMLVFATIIGLCFLACSCHVPLGKCVGCVCDETRRCCRKQIKAHTEPETAAQQRLKREKEAPALAKDEPPCAGCLRGVPWVLTCGYCCGAYGDAFTTDRQLAESAEEGKKPSVVVAQPVFFAEGEPTSKAVGAERATTATMPLLTVC